MLFANTYYSEYLKFYHSIAHNMRIVLHVYLTAFAGFDGGTEEEVDVIESVTGNLQWVSLECAINSGSIPEPEIVWVRRDSGGSSETILMDDTRGNTVRYIDSGQFLILETNNAAITDKEYFCKVTNKDQFQTESSPITYTLNGGESDLQNYC